jgi:putative tricarboxylic transport membrane protein
MTVIVVLPFTYGLDPLAGLAAMTGVYVGGSTGGLIACCLLGIPGSPASIATTFDGFPDARLGRLINTTGSIEISLWPSAPVAISGRLSTMAAERRSRWNSGHGIFLAVRAGDGDGRRAHQILAAQGLISTAIGLLITVVSHDPIGSVPRFTFGSSSSEAAFRSCPC